MSTSSCRPSARSSRQSHGPTFRTAVVHWCLLCKHVRQLYSEQIQVAQVMPNLRALFGAALGFVVQMPVDAVAQDSASESLSIAQTFVGVCGQNLGRYEGTIKQLQALGGKPLPDDIAVLVAPQDPDVEWEGFFFDDKGLPYAVGMSRAVVNGRVMASCVVALDNADVEEIVSITVEILRLGDPRVDMIEMGQRLRIWELEGSGVDSTLFVGDGMPSRINVISLALMAPVNEFSN